MDEQVTAALLDAERSGQAPRFEGLGDDQRVGTVLAGLAAGPLAPLAARALAAGAGWKEPVRDFAAGLAGQTSVLALQESVDALLQGPAAADAGPVLHDAMLDHLKGIVGSAPSLAAARLEAAVRTALFGAANPFLVLDRLAARPDGLPEEYLEALPGLVGIGLEVWGTDDAVAAPLVEVLEALTGTAAEGGAAHELACRRMRQALLAPDTGTAVAGLAEAAAMFAQAEALDEDRDDSAAYRACCEAVTAFARGDRSSVAGWADALTGVLDRRAAWHLGAYLPAWRAGARDAETAWLALVLDLRQAAERLGEESWLDARAAAGQLAAVYAAERALDPAPGLIAAVRPAVVTGVSRNAVLLGQLARMVEDDLATSDPVLPSAAAALLAAARAVPPTGDDALGLADRDRALGRVRRLAPSLLALGDDACERLAALGDDALRDAENIAAPPEEASSRAPHPGPYAGLRRRRPGGQPAVRGGGEGRYNRPARADPDVPA